MGLTPISGLRVMARGAVEQFGTDTMPWCVSRSSPLISGITRGTFGSMRNAELLSTTAAPFSTASGPISRLMPLPAHTNTRSTSPRSSGVAFSTVRSSPSTVSFLPQDRSEAHRRTCVAGKLRSSSMERKTEPTAPVAPITAIRQPSIAPPVRRNTEMIPPIPCRFQFLRRTGTWGEGALQPFQHLSLLGLELLVGDDALLSEIAEPLQR